MRTLVLKPSGLAEVKNKPWALVLRSHDLGGTDYEAIAYLDDSTAQEVYDAGRATWLYGKPDWDERSRKRDLEHARLLREEASIIEARVAAHTPVGAA